MADPQRPWASPMPQGTASTLRNDNRWLLSTLGTETGEIVKVFAEKKKREHASYFSIKSKETIINDFKDFIEENYSSGILHELTESGKLDTAFNQLADKWFTIEDFLSPEKNKVIKKQLTSTVSESDALGQMSFDCYTLRNKLSDEEKKEIPFDDFLSEVWYSKKTNPDGKVIEIQVTPHAKVTSVVELKKQRDRFTLHKTASTEKSTYYASLMETDRFDPSEKIACIAAANSLYTKVLHIQWKKWERLLDIWSDRFGDTINTIPVSAFTTWTTLSWLQQCLEGFFADAIHEWLLTKEDIDILQSISITSKSCIQYGKKSWEINTDDAVTQGKKFSELSQTIQSMTDKLVTTDVINNVEKKLNELDTSIENFAKVFNIPGTMEWFFKQFPMDQSVSKLTPAEKQEYDRLSLEEQSLREKAKIAQTTWDREQSKKIREEIIALVQQKNNIINAKQKDYHALHAKEEALREEAEACARSWDHDKVRQLEHEITSLLAQKKAFNETHLQSTMDDYINSIADSTKQHMQILGQTADDTLATAIRDALHTLQKNNRNAASLNTDQKNVLMQASILAQLAKVKTSDTLTDLSYDFDEYAQFVSGLFDLTSKQSVITTKDHHPIEINFSKKDIVGKPHDRQSISALNLTDLAQLRIEFEIDLDNDPGWQTEMFLKQITGGKKSQIIRDMPFTAPGFPKTITDSTRVELIGPDGEPYRWYLSPAYIEDSNHEDIGRWSSDLTYANTLVLYDKPADQYHPDRQVVCQKTPSWHKSDDGTPARKMTPIFLNADNYKNRQMQILEKKATLSDKYINALALGHILAQENDLDRIVQWEVKAGIDDLEKRLDTTNQHDPRESIPHHRSDHDAETSDKEDHSDHKKLTNGWKRLLDDDDKEKISIEPWHRFAFQTQKAIWPKTIPQNREFLSAKVTSVTTDDQGRAIAFNFEIENLTIGIPWLKKRVRKVDASNIDRFSDGTLFAKHHYLGQSLDLTWWKEDFDWSKKKLWSMFGRKWNPDFSWSVLDELTLQDDGVFKKGEHIITKFTAPNMAKSLDKDDKKQYDVDYTITKKWDKYHIKSSGYAIDYQDEKGKKEKILSAFETTTDLTGLLLIIANKKLIAYTDSEIDEGTKNDVVPTTRPKTRRSPSTVIEFIKGGGTSMIEAWKKRREDSNKADFEYKMFHEFNIYRRLEGKFGSILEHFDMNFLDDLADEKEAAWLEYGWKKIEWDFQQIDKFHHSYNVNLFGDGESWGKWANAMCEARVDAAMAAYEAGYDGVRMYKYRYKAAAALLYMLKKYKNGTARLMNKYPRGTYVKILFGAPAYKVFLERYKEKKKLLENSKFWSKIQEDLMTMEYDFICHNIAGWPLQDERVRDMDPHGDKWWGNMVKNQDAWYFQRLYSRKYGSELRSHIGAIKAIDPSPGGTEVKKMIEGGTFAHMRNEYYNHIGQFRMDDAVAELVAMQQLATTQDEANEVFVAMMLGILNGGLTQNLGKETRDRLRRTCRNSGIPFPPRMEHHDAQQKVQRLLTMITQNLPNGEKSFDNLTYTRKTRDGSKTLAEWVKYSPSNFTELERTDGNDMGAFIGTFKDRLGEGTEARKRVINFLTMDNIKDDSNDDNMMHIWKSKDENLTVFGKKIDSDDKKLVTEMMDELYFNKDRWQSLEELNRAYRYNGDFEGYTWWLHTRTMIEPAYNIMNKLVSDWSFELGAGDHAEWLWTSIKRRIPSHKLADSQKYKMAFFVDEFFRCFKQVGTIQYDKNIIEKFYRRIKIIQDNPSLSSHDKKRLLWFYITELAYANGSIPLVVEDALAAYWAFFENNLHLFDAEMADMHLIPGAWWWGKSFKYIFDEDNNHLKYQNDKTRKKKKTADREREFRDAQWQQEILINGEMDQANRNALGTRNNQSRWYIGSTIDDKIDSLRKSVGNKLEGSPIGWGGGSTTGGTTNNHTSDLQSQIHATNNDLIKRSDIKPWPRKDEDMAPEEKEKKEKEKEIRRIAQEENYAMQNG